MNSIEQFHLIILHSLQNEVSQSFTLDHCCFVSFATSPQGEGGRWRVEVQRQSAAATNVEGPA